MDLHLAREAIERSYDAIATGRTDDMADYIHDDYVNDEATAEPPAARSGGPAGQAATVLWLRTAFSELSFTHHDLMVDDDRYISYVTMRGRHTGPFVIADGDRHVVFPPTGRRFAHRQVHIGRFVGGKVVSHSAVRDDLGQMNQLGFAPPTPRAIWLQFSWGITGRKRAAIRAFRDLEPAHITRTAAPAAS